jgi:regulator of protease activity HflC (stomatin/prohibitin superfamily)
MKRGSFLALALMLIGSLLACSFFGQQVTIAENERGVVANDQGELQVLKPGTQMLSPFSGEVTLYSLADQTYAMAEQSTPDSNVQGNDAVEARSKDGRQLWISAAVTFHYVESRLTDVRKTWQAPDRFVGGFIRPTTRNVIYNTAVQYDMADAVSTKRSELEAAISQQLATEFAKQGAELVKFSLLEVRGN